MLDNCRLNHNTFWSFQKCYETELNLNNHLRIRFNSTSLHGR